MKVLRIINSMNPEGGGPCQGIRNAVPEWSNLGHETLVLSLDDPESSFLNKDPFEINAIGPSKTSWGYSENLKPWLIENSSKFDVIIVHGLWQYHSYCTLSVLHALKRNNNQSTFPSIYVMPHGMLDPYFQKAKGRKLKAIRNYFYWKLLEHKVIEYADGILFTCQEELLLARTTFKPYKPVKELNVGYGIPQPPKYSQAMLETFKRNCPEVGSDYLLFLSRIHPKKGVDLLIEAYAQIFKENNALPQLVIAGPGMETVFGNHLKASVERHHLQSKIIFPGMLSGDSKWSAFYGCEAFVLPSHQENFGISIAEAMACGKPVLISNQVNIWREIESSGAGIVQEDTLQGTKQMLSLWTAMDKDEKLQMETHASTCYKTYFTTEGTCKNMIQATSNKK